MTKVNFSKEMSYLKSVGSNLDVKVTVKPNRAIYIRDTEFHTFEKALAYLRHIQETEMAPEVKL